MTTPRTPSPPAAPSTPCMDKLLGKSIGVERGKEIRDLHGKIKGAVSECVKDAVRIGELLTLQKAQLDHGEWLPWIKAHCCFTDRWARSYMSLYEGRNKIQLTEVDGIHDALLLLNPPPVKSELSSDLKPETPAKAHDLPPPPAKRPIPPPPASRPPPAPDQATIEADEIERDMAGEPVPHNLLSLWERRREVEDLKQMVSTVRVALEKAHNTCDPLYAGMGIFQHVMEFANNLHASLAHLKPHVVCPKCKGSTIKTEQKCPACYGTGLISKFNWERLKGSFTHENET